MGTEVFIGEELKQRLSGRAAGDLVLAFEWWKSAADLEYESPVFGKDSTLFEPQINGKKYVIGHCHMIPLCDLAALAKWRRDFRLRTRKTSDRVLFYVQDGSRYYLIDIADDPGAHDLMRMTDQQGKSFMGRIAAEAARFLDGLIELAK